MKAPALLAAAALGLAAASTARAEPVFLALQYTRCTNCHYSPTGGGLLTPYGRSLTREELSTMGRSHGEAGATGAARGEEAFLYGALGNLLGPVSAQIELRPAHLDVRFPGGKQTLDMFMNADIAAAFRHKEWTVYGELGRQPIVGDTRVDSFEHWVGYKSERGWGARAGRFLPAYGIRFSDHTAFNRAPLGLDTFDQLYALELSYAGQRHLVQLTASPGRADSIVHDDGLKAFTAAGRWQFDVSSRAVLVASGLYHGTSDKAVSGGSTGLAFGFAPWKRLTVWTEGDVQFEKGAPSPPSYVVVNETSFQAFKGVWLKFSPQVITDFGDSSGGTFRLGFELNWLPRTHWNIDLSYYRDEGRSNNAVTKSFLAQLHLYL